VREVWPDENLADLRGARGAVKVVASSARRSARAPAPGHLALYVNGRHVRDRLLLRAVAQAYGSTLEGGRYPVGALLVEVPPEDVDVNVHPQKTEVRFASQGAVFEAVMTVLRDAAGAAPWAQAVARPRTSGPSTCAGPREAREQGRETPSIAIAPAADRRAAAPAGGPPRREAPMASMIPAAPPAALRPVGPAAPGAVPPARLRGPRSWSPRRPRDGPTPRAASALRRRRARPRRPRPSCTAAGPSARCATWASSGGCTSSARARPAW
jgi:DNA mismatch repair protein MutL